ncbi:MAG: hypothetical protein IJ458_02660 [Clostridia bacterium]|nr:hypothetical protein [Clostridia bacterium]
MFILGVTFSEFIQKGNVIIGIILAILGVACWLLAMHITKAIRKTETIKPNDTILIACKVVGLVSILVGMVLIAIPL